MLPALAPPALVPDLVRDLVLVHPVPAVRLAPAAQRPLAKRPVRSVLLPVDAAAGRSIPKPKKAR